MATSFEKALRSTEERGGDPLADAWRETELALTTETRALRSELNDSARDLRTEIKILGERISADVKVVGERVDAANSKATWAISIALALGLAAVGGVVGTAVQLGSLTNQVSTLTTGVSDLEESLRSEIATKASSADVEALRNELLETLSRIEDKQDRASLEDLIPGSIAGESPGQSGGNFSSEAEESLQFGFSSANGDAVELQQLIAEARNASRSVEDQETVVHIDGLLRGARAALESSDASLARLLVDRAAALAGAEATPEGTPRE